MTSFFVSVLDGSSAVGLCLLVCNVCSLIISFIYMHDNGLNFEHLTKEKGLKYLFIREYCEKLLLGTP